VLYGLLVCAAVDVRAQQNIRINQIGFEPSSPKKAIVLTSTPGIFNLKNSAGKTVYTGQLKRSEQSAFNGKYTYIADFSSFQTPGKYVVNVPAVGASYPFKIQKSVLGNVARGTIRAYYFIRASIPLKVQYAGKWARAEGHPDTAVFIHASAVGPGRAEGYKISSPRGWYDAGDYNKYIVNSGISTATLLSLYEDFPGYMKGVNLNIPESENSIPDVLDEALWNIRWMLTMQDPHDGGVYHKLTNAVFDPFIMPDKATTKRYVVEKTTAATLDFAAVMAQATRIFKNYRSALPGLSDSCLKAAQQAWGWARQNPHVLYNQNLLNEKYAPKITTGTYGDFNVSDEFIWAAAELFTTTGNKTYIDTVNILPDGKMPLPNWGQVRLLGYYTLSRYTKALSKVIPAQVADINKRLIAFADQMVAGANENAYQTVMDKSVANFNWGSNANAGNQGVALLQAYLLTSNRKYLDYAVANLDYILGRNGTGYCYVTGFGSKPSMHPHHRPSVADSVVDPVPGLVVGGANPGMQDSIPTASKVPDEAYVDDDRAYSVNEIAINWNAPVAYLANAVEAIYGHNFALRK